ncbi:DLA class II histocompatibility antigen, DR-1 beta chain-like isoform X2 [Seriola lalandi dorsalis]|uniref:DLA class II histocompatibility antigen, DR-1 beta chain-like isoform X2 n=1 Tax=Seriola lalandi dorsalis TaxID=1841481 RepID=UPI000C6FB0E7|nr:DLA class II histocompatibility antigen, DR-1 beta chain-like isoform X2 [Seriola lalandi dorsalis]
MHARSCFSLLCLFLSFLRAVEPYVKLRSVETVSSRHPGMLLCSAYNFYPKQIRVTWLRDGKMVTSDVTSSDELSNGNWLYQIHSYLEYTPRPGEKITCMVEHASLKEPTLYDWDPMPESQRNKIAVGTAGLVLGLVLFLVGVIYYKRNATDRVLVPSS